MSSIITDEKKIHNQFIILYEYFFYPFSTLLKIEKTSTERETSG